MNNGYKKSLILIFIISIFFVLNGCKKRSIHELACSGRISTIEQFVKKKNVDLNARDDGGWTLLHWAAVCRRVNVAALFIASGADIDARDNSGNTPLHVAAMNSDKTGSIRIIQFLISKDADIHAENNEGVNALHLAAGRGNVKVVKLLIEKGLKVDKKDKFGFTPLCRVFVGFSDSGDKDVIQFLLQKGANPLTKDKQGFTPVEHALAGDEEEGADLLASVIDFNKPNDFGLTPLHYAIRMHNVKMVKLFLKHGADPNLRDSQGKTPLYVAKYSIKNNEMVETLRTYGAPDEEREPKDTLTEEEFMNDLKKFIAKGGDIDKGGKKIGVIPLRTAVILDFDNVFEFLLEKGANPNATLEKEVAIDPEMLGKIFEKLGAINDSNFAGYIKAIRSSKKSEESKFNKKFGVYYTPREVVHYMCQESLINYLDTIVNTVPKPISPKKAVQNKLFGKPEPQQLSLSADGYEAIVPRQDLAFLVKHGESALEHDKRVNAEGRETKTYPYRMPKTIRKNAKAIDRALESIKVCDPAIGSGAFPVGIMTEITRTRNVLTNYLDDKSSRSIFSFKWHIIEHSLYGVDIDPGAVEIAKLRLWLSLVVEEQDIRNIKPLPNLSYRIIQGNSLLDSLFGHLIQLDVIAKKPEVRQLIKATEVNKHKYFQEWQSNKKNALELQILTKQIDLATFLIDAKGAAIIYTENMFGEEAMTPKQFKEKAESSKKTKELSELKVQVASAKKCLEHLINQKDVLSDDELRLLIHQYKISHSTFIWYLDFADVFNNEGFDIIIANPPYGADFDKEQKGILKQRFEYISERIRNSFLYFLGLGYELTKRGGVVCYILPNEFLFQIYMTKARTHFIKKTQTLFAINLGEGVFEAIVPTCLFAFKKQQLHSYDIPVADFRHCKLENLSDKLNSNSYSNLPTHTILNSPNAAFSFDLKRTSLVSKLATKFPKFESFCQDVANGISTSCDNIYIVPEELAKKKKFEKEHLKPCIRGGQFERYFCPDKTHEYVLYITRDFDEKSCRNISNYLAGNKETLIEKCVEKRSGNRKWHVLFRARYRKLFTPPKILIRQTADSIIAAVDSDVGYYCIDSVNIASLKSEYVTQINYLVALLNSSLLNFFYKEISQEKGRVLAQVKPQRIKSLPIPHTSNSEQKLLLGIVSKIVDIKREKDCSKNPSKQAMVKKLEKQIDQMVYKFYNLTPKEIAIVENSAKSTNGL